MSFALVCGVGGRREASLIYRDTSLGLKQEYHSSGDGECGLK